MRNLVSLLKDTYQEWRDDAGQRMGAALAYYTLFSLAPLLILAIAIAGLVFGQKAAEGQIINQIRWVVGPRNAATIQNLLRSVHLNGHGRSVTVIGVITIVVGASGVLSELKDSLNKIWHAPKVEGFYKIIKDRFISLTMILGIGFVMIVSLIINAAVAAMGEFLSGFLPAPAGLLQAGNLVASFIVITLLFALMFKALPDLPVRWRDVWVGAVVTSLLFTIGKFLLALYIGKSRIASPFGAAGSMVVVLVWVYYSAQIFYFGAEFTKIYAKHQGSYKTAA